MSLVISKYDLSFFVIIFGIFIYPLYYTSIGVKLINRDFIEISYTLLSVVLLLNYPKRNNIFNVLILITFIFIILEYNINRNLIQVIAPASEVSLIAGISNNTGIILFSLVSFLFIINDRFTNYLLMKNTKNINKLLFLYYLFYSLIALYSFISTYGSLDSTNSVNGHAYHLSAIAILIYIFYTKTNSSFSIFYKLLFIYNFIIVLFVFKTRGVVPIAMILLLYSFIKLDSRITYFFKRIPLIKLFMISMYFLSFILVFFSDIFSEFISLLSGGIELFEKESTGKRDIAILQWSYYLYAVYSDLYYEVPIFTPHSTFVGLPAYMGIIYSIFFLFFLLTLFIKSLQKNFRFDYMLLIGSLGIFFSVAFVSPLSNIIFLIILSLIFKFGIGLDKWGRYR